LVYFSPNVVAHKQLDPITREDVYEAFGKNVQVETETENVLHFIEEESTDKMVLLMMSSGNFDGIDYGEL
jgi:UDP-N-acetylmuramate: L-alanyl-gamma-D-glutamyl-meso-diaminopimelate ligase